MMEILLASRCECNECSGKEMFSCIANDGIVECYFPTQSAHDRNSDYFLAARDLEHALREALKEMRAFRSYWTSPNMGLKRGVCVAEELAAAALLKLEGRRNVERNP